VAKRYLMQVAAFNLGVVMRALFGVGKPRGLQGRDAAVFAALVLLVAVLTGWVSRWCAGHRGQRSTASRDDSNSEMRRNSTSSTGC
jgi:hypothetical protein